MATFTEILATATDDGAVSYGSLDTGPPVLGTNYGDSAARAFFRFTNVTIPAGSTVTAATLTVTPNFADTGTLATAIRGVAANSQPAFTTAASVTGAATTTASATVTATQASWNTGTPITVTVTSVVAEVVARAGWASGNALAFVSINTGSTGNGYFEAVGAPSAGSASLSVTYTPPAGTVPTGAASGGTSWAGAAAGPVDPIPTGTAGRGWSTSGTASGTAPAVGIPTGSATGRWSMAGAASGTTPALAAPLPTPITSSARWSWAVGPWSGLPTAELANATARSLKLALAGTSSASFAVDGTTADAAQVQELVTDVWAMRNGITLFRGRVGPTTDDLDGSKHTVSVTVGDYRALLQRRILYDGDQLVYTNTEQTGIGGHLIGTTQSHPGGYLQIVGVPNTTNVPRTITYPAGQSIGQAIETLSQMDNGFNWDIVPTTGTTVQMFRVWASRGDNKERVLSYPGNLATVRRAVDPSTYANAVRETGGSDSAGNQIAAVSLDAPDVALRAEGRWDKQAGDTSLIDPASLTAHANYDLANSQQITPTYTVVMQPGEWGGPTDIWLGDVVLLHVSSGRLAVNGEPLRVWEIGIDLDDADNETVTLTLAALDPTKQSRARQWDRRLTALERS